MMIPGIPSAAPRRAACFLAFGLSLITLASTAEAAVLTGIRHSTSKERTRVVLDLSAKASYSHRVLDDPPRVVVDLKGTEAGAKAGPVSVKDGTLQGVRVNDVRDGSVQVVLDLERNAAYKVFALADPFRVVVDLSRAGAPAAGTAKPAPAAGTAKPAPATGGNKPPENGSGDRSASGGTPAAGGSRPPLEIAPPPRDKWVIAIDAGHGGQDHGARHFKTSEKDITLALARELMTELGRRQGIEPLLVRKGDYYIPLRRRWTLAEKQGADLFVSLHCNAAEDSGAQGTEVFFLSLKGATDARSQDLAERENEVDQIMGVAVSEDDIDAIVYDMMQTDVLAKSQILAESCLTHLFGIGTVYGRGVKQAGFAVLKSPRMPSILIEAAFISHKKENELLRDAGWQREFARRLADGVEAYVRSVDTAEKLEKP